MVDVYRVNRTMAHIEANLALWDQTRWVTENACGTAYCFAGWSLQLEGIRVCTADCDKLGGAHVHRDQIPGSILERMRGTYPIMSVPQVSRVVLGLTTDQAWPLFCGGNTLELLKTQVSRLTRTRDHDTQPTTEKGKHDV